MVCWGDLWPGVVEFVSVLFFVVAVLIFCGGLGVVSWSGSCPIGVWPCLR